MNISTFSFSNTNIKSSERAEGSGRKRKFNNNITQQADQALKKSRPNTDDNNNSLPIAEKIEDKDERYSRIRDGIEPLHEMLRDDAFALGPQARQMHIAKIVKGLDAEDLKELGITYLDNEMDEDRISTVRLKKAQYKNTEEVANNKSKRVASQLLELYQILEKSRTSRKPDGEKILALAHKIIEELPERETVEVAEEVDEKYHTIAEKFAEEMPFDLSEEHLAQLSSRLQNAIENGPKEETTEDEQREELEDLASTKMGHLLLVAQHNIKTAATCASVDTMEESLKLLTDSSFEIIEEANLRIEEHTAQHRKTAIQGTDEATFHKMSIEMAKLVLLDTGSVNFGIMSEVAQMLIPDSFKDTIAIQNLWQVLADLDNKPHIWENIAKIKPPESKEIPSDQSIRVCLGLKPSQEITKRDAQILVLSALFGHFRQAKAGTCFTSACLIKALYYNLDHFVEDLAMATEKGEVTRTLLGEERQFPFQARISKEYLDTLITVDEDGKLLSTRKYELIRDDWNTWPQPENGAYLYESPGIQAACQAMGIEDVKGAVLAVLPQLTAPFVINDIINELANVVLQKQENLSHGLRSQTKYSIEELVQRGQYAFGAQTNHPLHRAYEQIGTSMVYYFGSQYCFPAWIHQSIELTLDKADKGFPPKFQNAYKKLLKEIFLPMVIRMRFRYNHHFENTKTLFDDGNHGIKENHFFGYELCDTGLPKDFKYSTRLHEFYKSESSWLHLERFKEYAPTHTWKLVDTEEKFRDFVQNVIRETTQHLKSTADTDQQKLLDRVGKKMFQDVAKPSFTKKATIYLLGKDSDQKKELNKNEHTLMTKPWKFMWGGDFDAVLNTYFGFIRSPSKLKNFIGSPKEVLAKSINFVKNQPDQIKDTFDDPRSQIIVDAPVHVFLMKPSEESFQEAWQSDLSTNEYIKKHVEKPGLEVANSQIPQRERKKLIDFVANNMWVGRHLEKDDFERQRLTELAQENFEELVIDGPDLFRLKANEFENALLQIVYKCRSEDEKIGKRNTPWEKHFERVLHNKVKSLIPENRMHRRIHRDAGNALINFAKNREDSIALSEEGKQQFLQDMEQTPGNISIKNFRNRIVKTAYKAHYKDLCGHDHQWKEKFGKYLDEKLFKILPKDTQTKLIKSGIITHDPNWKRGIHDCRFTFMVNPGTGKIELCTYIPDIKKMEFEEQSHWFPKKEKGHSYWRFPENHLTYPGEPPINVKKLMDV